MHEGNTENDLEGIIVEKLEDINCCILGCVTGPHCTMDEDNADGDAEGDVAEIAVQEDTNIGEILSTIAL